MTTCRWCGQPIRTELGAWLHAVPGGGFYCRTELAPASIWPPPPAEPAPPVPGPAIGRHTVGTAVYGSDRR
jgi:hypothetical protein